jgi:hypothetical protein
MESARLRRWAIAVVRDGVEKLAHWHPMTGESESITSGQAKQMEEANPNLRGKLRVVPVVVDIREMTEEEEAAFRKASEGE